MVNAEQRIVNIRDDALAYGVRRKYAIHMIEVLR
jgi:hypothetical protein